MSAARALHEDLEEVGGQQSATPTPRQPPVAVPQDFITPKKRRLTQSRSSDALCAVDSARKSSLDATAKLRKQIKALGPKNSADERAQMLHAKINSLNADAALCTAHANLWVIEYDEKERSNDLENYPNNSVIMSELQEAIAAMRYKSATYTIQAHEIRTKHLSFLESYGPSSFNIDTLQDILTRSTKEANKKDESAPAGGWKASLVALYNAASPTNGMSTKHKAEWCPVLKHYIQDKKDMIAAHIVPKSFGATLLGWAVGMNLPTTTFEGNGILLYKNVEKHLGRGNVVLVPVDDEASPIELRIVVIEDKLLEQEVSIGRRWRDLDGTTLEFKSDFRPMRRMLYLRYAMSLIHAIRVRKLTLEKLQEKINCPPLCWASPGKYIRKSALRAIADLLGHAFPHTFDDDDDESSLDPAGMSREELYALLVARVDEIAKEEEDEEEDDERTVEQLIVNFNFALTRLAVKPA